MLPKDGNTTLGNGQSRQAGPDGVFPEVFDALMMNGTDQATPTALPLTQFNPLGPALTHGMPASMSNPQLSAQPLNGQAELAAFVAVSGKHLPGMNWSGVNAVADPNGSAAMSYVGDEQGVLLSQPTRGDSIEQAVNRSQQQLQQQLFSGPQFSLKSMTPQPLGLPDLLAQQLLTAQAETNLNEVTPLSQSTGHVMPTGLLQGLSASELSGALGGQRVQADMINAQLNDPNWHQQVGERIHWMVSRGLQQAEIRLNPPELGALEVKIQIQGDQTQISFSSPHASVRDALDSAIPRLREMLAESGINMADVNVSDQSADSYEASQQQGGDGEGGQFGEANGEDELMTAPADQVQSGNRLLDIYA